MDGTYIYILDMDFRPKASERMLYEKLNLAGKCPVDFTILRPFL